VNISSLCVFDSYSFVVCIVDLYAAVMGGMYGDCHVCLVWIGACFTQSAAV
jgi:hypothetical protein